MFLGGVPVRELGGPLKQEPGQLPPGVPAVGGDGVGMRLCPGPQERGESLGLRARHGPDARFDVRQDHLPELPHLGGARVDARDEPGHGRRGPPDPLALGPRRLLDAQRVRLVHQEVHRQAREDLRGRLLAVAAPAERDVLDAQQAQVDEPFQRRLAAVRASGLREQARLLQYVQIEQEGRERGVREAGDQPHEEPRLREALLGQQIEADLPGAADQPPVAALVTVLAGRGLGRAARPAVQQTGAEPVEFARVPREVPQLYVAGGVPAQQPRAAPRPGQIGPGELECQRHPAQAPGQRPRVLHRAGVAREVDEDLGPVVGGEHADRTAGGFAAPHGRVADPGGDDGESGSAGADPARSVTG